MFLWHLVHILSLVLQTGTQEGHRAAGPRTKALAEKLRNGQLLAGKPGNSETCPENNV